MEKKENTMIAAKESVPFTTERFYMEHANQHGLASLHRHLNRYKWACSHVHGLEMVLDAGCGSGYGDLLLTNACSYVVGVDQSREAVEYARTKAAQLGAGRVRYEVARLGDITAILNMPRFDAVVCIEVIEHLREEEQRAFREALKRILKPDGRLFITTPIKNEQTGELKTHFHEREFTREEFTSYLSEAFASVAFDDAAQFHIPEDFLLAVCGGLK